MAKTSKEDAGGRVNSKPAKSPRTRRRKKRAYEYKLERVREVDGSQMGDKPEGAFGYWSSVIATSGWFQETKEHLVILLLNSRLAIEGHNLVSIGTLESTTAHPRDILAPVLCGAAHGFILMHNHPSGDPTPSDPDKALTRRIIEGANLLELRFVDHIIAGRESANHDDPYYSFKCEGIL